MKYSHWPVQTLISLPHRYLNVILEKPCVNSLCIHVCAHLYKLRITHKDICVYIYMCSSDKPTEADYFYTVSCRCHSSSTKLWLAGRRWSIAVSQSAQWKVLHEVSKGVEVKTRGRFIGSQKGGRALFIMEFNSGVIPPSARASRLSMFSRTTEAAFSAVMLIPPATPSTRPRDEHAVPHSFMQRLISSAAEF